MYIFGSRGLAILTNWSRSKWAPRCRFIIIYLRRALNHAYQAEFAWRRHQPHGRNREESRRRERKVVSPPRIINRLANLTSVLYTFESHTRTIQSRAIHAPRDLCVKAQGPLFPHRFINARVTRVITAVLRSCRSDTRFRDLLTRSLNPANIYIILFVLNKLDNN